MVSCRAPYPILSLCFLEVLEQGMKCFGAVITKKPRSSPKNAQKMLFLGLKQCFWDLSGEW